MAVDVKGLIGALQMQGHAVPAGGPYAPIFTDLYDPKTMPPLPYDTAGARRLLEQKGWVDRNGDGIREKDGKPLSFTLLINAGNVRRSDVAQIVQQAWKQLGVDARIQSVEFNTFSDRQRKKQFDAVVGGWSIGLSPDLTTLWALASPFNFVSYDDPRTEALFKQAQEAPTAAQSNALWREAAARIAQAQPYTFLYFMDQLDGVNRLQGMKVDTYGAYQNTWEWWIPKRLQNTGAGSAGARARPAPADTTHKA
jgi:peptide/nickel transport system substrate-binding protein